MLLVLLGGASGRRAGVGGVGLAVDEHDLAHHEDVVAAADRVGERTDGLEHAVALVAGGLVGRRAVEAPDRVVVGRLVQDLRLRAELRRRLGAVDPDVFSLDSHVIVLNLSWCCSGVETADPSGDRVFDAEGCQRAVADLLPDCERRVNWRAAARCCELAATGRHARLPFAHAPSVACPVDVVDRARGRPGRRVRAGRERASAGIHRSGGHDARDADRGRGAARRSGGRARAERAAGAHRRSRRIGRGADTGQLQRVLRTPNRGLLGFALDPAYVTSGFVYVYRTIPSGGPGGCSNRVSRFFMTSNGLDLGSERILIDGISSVNGNHNGGDIEIGNDGYLYIATGDAGRDPRGDSGGAGSQRRRPGPVAAQRQDPARRPVDGTRPHPEIRSPGPGPPTVGSAATRRAHRRRCAERSSPSGCAIRSASHSTPTPAQRASSSTTSGQNTREEVNEGAAGANYGWPLREGRCPQGQNPPCAGPTGRARRPDHRLRPRRRLVRHRRRVRPERCVARAVRRHLSRVGRCVRHDLGVGRRGRPRLVVRVPRRPRGRPTWRS